MPNSPQRKGARAAINLEIRGLGKQFATRTGLVPAISSVSLTAAPGEFVTIVGPSGCGKSTMLKIMLGVIEPDSGIVLFNGRESKGPRSDVGMVFQTPALPPWWSVLDNVLLPIKALGLRTSEYLERARMLLKMVELSGFESSYPRELSGGMQQRVSLCRALIHEPQLLLMDEPFGAIDAITREILQVQLLRIWKETKTTVLLVTHSIDEAVFLGTRVLLMSARPGKIIDDVSITLPDRNRSADVREMPEFQKYTHRLREGLGLTRIGT